MNIWLSLGGALLAIWLFLRLLKLPIRKLFRLGLNLVLGGILLLAADWLGGYIGIQVGVNRYTLAIVGLLGLPGLALILMLQWFLLAFCT